jgi:hypothetical protein
MKAHRLSVHCFERYHCDLAVIRILLAKPSGTGWLGFPIPTFERFRYYLSVPLHNMIPLFSAVKPDGLARQPRHSSRSAERLLA